jgi:hypothetical protein
MNREELITASGELGFQLLTPGKRILSDKRVLDVLDELSVSEDPRLIEGFPVVLANSFHRGIKPDINDLLSRHDQGTQERIDLEKLVLASLDLLTQEGLDQPDGLDSIVDSLRLKYGNLLDQEVLELSGKRSVSTERLINTLRRYVTDLDRSESALEREKKNQLRTFTMNLHLSTLFSSKQKELVLKKLKGEPLSKTEREYYSRVVKKKLEALANSELNKVAATLTKKRDK